MPQSFAEQFRSIPMSSNLGASLERAHGFARAQAHRSVLLEHLLLALIEDPDAAGVLRASNIDPTRLGTDASDYLGRLMDDMRAEPGTEPRPDGELLRVLHAAGQAAQQSRRRQIDGAIVLAAIVGDGKSPAAGMLKTLGLGFEEAIRALQKANAQARSKQFAPPPPAAVRQAATLAEPPPKPVTPPPPQPAPEPPRAEAAAEPPETPQTVEEILAAARARIQRRTAAIAGIQPPAKSPQPAPPPAMEAPPAPVEAPQPVDQLPEPALQAPPETETPAPDAVPSPAPPMPATAEPSFPAPQPSWTPPPPAPRLPEARPQPSRPGGQALPFPPHANPQEGVGRPPLPGRVGSAPAPQPGLPGRHPVAPWPNTAEPQARPPVNGAAGAAPLARPGPQRAGQRPGAGPLVETIPRRMRVGLPAQAQVRIARDKVDGLILLLLGNRGGPRSDAFLMRALTVRLVAPDGGFWIETGSPETQWIETAPQGVHQDDHVSWRWTVVPQKRGRHRLLLVVSARTVGRDALPSETAPPDRVIEVTVKGSLAQRILQWLRLLAVLTVGVAIGLFASEIVAFAETVLRRLLG